LWEKREDLKKKLEKMDEKEEEDHSPLILVLPELDGKKSPSTTQDSAEKNNIEGIDKAII
jgi:hypothetical protein